MNKSLSLMLVAATLLVGVQSPAFASSSQCKAQKTANKNAVAKDKKADDAVKKQTRTISSLENKVESYTRSVETAIATRDRAYTREIERAKVKEDKEENRRREAIERAAILAAQIAACATADGLNGLLGTSLECGPDARNQLLAAAANTAKVITDAELKVKAARDRGQRTANSKYKQYDIKVKQQQAKLTRAQQDLAKAKLRLPVLVEQAEQTQKAVDLTAATLAACQLGQP